MATLKSYDLNGKKLSFANWISELSPMETPFSSMTNKESIQQTLFQWQTDHLSKAGPNYHSEGDVAIPAKLGHTDTKSNITQILRKTVSVSDTANATDNYGRQKEIVYQTEHAAKELRRDIEWALLNNTQAVTDETADQGRLTAGFSGLVAPFNAIDYETGAKVHFKIAGNKVSSEDIFEMTYNLYLSGSDADTIMFHPKHASLFSALQESTDGSRQRVFKNTPKFSVEVNSLVDPLGQEYKLLPNRWMPEGYVYFFNASDWTQMILRAPQRTKLAKDGSYEKWMIETELGLRHRNPFASGVLVIESIQRINEDDSKKDVSDFKLIVGSKQIDMLAKPAASDESYKTGDKLAFTITKQAAGGGGGGAGKVGVGAEAPKWDTAILVKDGNSIAHWTITGTAASELLITSNGVISHAGVYQLKLMKADGSAPEAERISSPIYLHMKK